MGNLPQAGLCAGNIPCTVQTAVLCTMQTDLHTRRRAHAAVGFVELARISLLKDLQYKKIPTVGPCGALAHLMACSSESYGGEVGLQLASCAEGLGQQCSPSPSDAGPQKVMGRGLGYKVLCKGGSAMVAPPLV